MSQGKAKLRVLHTSDWHLGRALYGKKRYEEFEAFLAWLAGVMEREQARALVVAGDIFDSGTPSNRAQGLYYRFLRRAAASPCRHVVVVAGNHDSPSFLNAPKELLKALDVHVVGNASDNLEDELVVLDDDNGSPELIVCAVPYLRDRDIRTAQAGESLEDKERKLIEGVRAHYAAVAALAEKKRAELGADAPILATGHLFTAGGKTIEGDGVRELYVGSLAHVAAGAFPKCLDYLALGHLHIPQKVGGSELMRYCGAPIPMGFAEAGRPKSVCLVEFSGTKAGVRQIEVPVFQELERVKGDWPGISGRMAELAANGSRAWLEVVYEGGEVIGDLRERLEAAAAETEMEILRIQNNRVMERVLAQARHEETLEDLKVEDVFERCLDAHEVPEDQRPGLLRAYGEAVASLHENDAREE